ncbi:MAG: ABC transporter permease [Eubacteriales bacterium]|nr:ABC transporter permease [Eubacteriales bacterium]
MKRKIKILTGTALFCLCALLGLGQLRTLQRGGSAFHYQSQTAISLETAEEIQEDAAGKESLPDLTFWREETNQTIATNVPAERTATVTVLTVSGNPSLLTGNFQIPAAGDISGCLLDSHTAWELFGSENVIGAAVTYGEKEYIIRGVLEGFRGTLIIQASKDEKTGFNRIAAADTGEQKSREIEENLKNRYQIDVILVKSRFSDLLTGCIPSKWSDFSFYGSFFQNWKEEVEQVLQAGLSIFEVRRLWSALALGCCILAGGCGACLALKNFFAEN